MVTTTFVCNFCIMFSLKNGLKSLGKIQFSIKNNQFYEIIVEFVIKQLILVRSEIAATSINKMSAKDVSF